MMERQRRLEVMARLRAVLVSASLAVLALTPCLAASARFASPPGNRPSFIGIRIRFIIRIRADAAWRVISIVR
jgi:hypothetical protein